MHVYRSPFSCYSHSIFFSVSYHWANFGPQHAPFSRDNSHQEVDWLNTFSEVFFKDRHTGGRPNAKAINTAQQSWGGVQLQCDRTLTLESPVYLNGTPVGGRGCED